MWWKNHFAFVQILTKWSLKKCTRHDISVVLVWAKCCCNMIISNWITTKWNFHQIRILMENRQRNGSKGSGFCMPLTYWGRAKMDNNVQTTFSSAVYWMTEFEFPLTFQVCHKRTIVHIGWGNGMVPKRPKPMVSKIASIGHNELRF